MNNKKFKFAIDRGGTFTDVFAITPEDKIITLKLLSRNTEFYPDAPTYAINKIIAEETGASFQPDELINSDQIEWIRMGTTVATNALLESKGERFCLLTTKGFKDLLYIGNQSRPNLFDLSIQMPNILYEDIIEVEERVTPLTTKSPLDTSKVITLPNEQSIEVITELNLEKLEQDLKNLVATKSIRNIAVLLMHSYIYNDHEKKIEELASSLGIKSISLSHKISPMIRAVPRGLTTCIDAYLTPCIQEYLDTFKSKFNSQIKSLLFMQSDGGLTSMADFTGSKAILSGPAGGVVGYAMTSYSEATKQPVIGFDMGGTSTDVSRYDGQYEHTFETITAGYSLQIPQLDINTIAAGGGSMLFFQAGMFVVGPESASSEPGPACYKKGGPLTITDANLVLGRLIPDFFPKIFGPKQNEPMDYNASRALFEKQLIEVNIHQKSKGLKEMTVEELASGYIRVANEAMCRPIRNLTEGKGYDTRKHILACFGGAGGQHACAIARSLGIHKIVISKYSGILSAYGLSLADVVHEEQEPCNLQLNEGNMNSFVSSRITVLQAKCTEYLIQKEDFKEEDVSTKVFLNLRYDGTDTGIMCQASGILNGTVFRFTDFEESFLQRYKQEYGFTLDRQINIDDIRIRGIGKYKTDQHSVLKPKRLENEIKPIRVESVYFNGQYLNTNIFNIEDMLFSDRVQGPAIIIDKNSTLLIEPNSTAFLKEDGDLEVALDRMTVNSTDEDLTLDTTQLSVFSHRFMSIAEQMGRILQRTSVSTNIKERLDYSCAMFDSTGGLVANAPHIPVHLGAMQEAVKFQIKNCPSICKGDVILSNHPGCGGSHLPDLTIITPVFNSDSNSPVFYVANRGHHSDIGGLTPGSMPPSSTKLWQEGATFKSFKIVENNIFKEAETVEAFNYPARYPGCSGSRNLSDNISDLKAQIAANKKGIDLINQLIDEYGLNVVLSYMKHIQNTAEQSVRTLLKAIALNSNNGDISVFEAQEFLDDGTNLDISIRINKLTGNADFDFTGTGYQVNGNLNTPRAITLSAIIYCIRCMLKHDIPLNQGCLSPINVNIPEGSILWPDETSAVVGGNVLTSQRIVDVIFKALKVCGASQGCMNNITFGNDEGGYYETVGGGAGAGPTWNGRHGIHTHMTNTRITDVEILENRYPVMINKFSLRPLSGGIGEFNGGDGLIRELVFKDNLNLCVLTERRVFHPYGLEGAGPGQKGRNTLITKDGRFINLGSKSEIRVEPGDIFRLETPGGGGYGTRAVGSENKPSELKKVNQLTKGSLHNYDQIQSSA